MKPNNIITAAAIVLFLAGIAHLVRLFYSWEVAINGWNMPIWISLIGTIIPIYLSYNLLKSRN
jgi:hypothetical protein